MTGELVRVFGDRPGYVEVPAPTGGSVRISIAAHDAWYLSELAEWRQRLAAAHPHGGGTSRAFLQAHRAYKRFEAEEARWYSAYDLTAPARSLASPRPPSALRAARVSSRAQHVAAYLAQHPDAVTADVAATFAADGHRRSALWLARPLTDLATLQGAKQVAVARYLAARPEALAREIAAALGLSLKSVHHAIDKLRDKGFAIPYRCTGPRKRCRPHLSAPASAQPPELESPERQSV